MIYITIACISCNIIFYFKDKGGLLLYIQSCNNKISFRMNEFISSNGFTSSIVK
jgi:hypothetical protein